MKTTELNAKIAEGTKKYGSKNAYLCSDEYKIAYKKWQIENNSDNVKKEVKEVQILKREDGYVISFGKNRYLAHTGTDFGMLAGMSIFKTYMQAKKMCDKLNYKVK
jgi:hypothetical protein